VSACCVRLLQVGSPFGGKSTVSHTLAQAFGLKLLSPQELVAEAIAAAKAWQQQQSDQTATAAVSRPASASSPATAVKQSEAASTTPPSPLVELGLHADAALQAGQPTPDHVLVQLLLLGMQQAKTHVHVPLEPPAPEPTTKGSKGPTSKAGSGGKQDTGAAGGRHSAGGAPPSSTAGASAVLGAAAALAAGLGSAGPGPALPANLAPGIPGRGFVLDGLPATEAQAVLLEKALTGLDLTAEQELLQGASVIAPPPVAKLPQLQRPLLSGLDAVVLLECADEGLALQRVLGRRLDPVTGACRSNLCLECKAESLLFRWTCHMWAPTASHVLDSAAAA
jgi:hypothetical protein